MVPISVPPTAGRALVLQAAGAAAVGRVVLLQGAAAGRALLLGAAAPGRVTLVAVGGAAAASRRRPRCSSGAGNQQFDGDDEAKVFGEILQEMALGVVVQGDEELLSRLATTAKDASELLETMMNEASSPIPDNVHQEFVLVRATFTEVEGHCEMGYVTDASVVAATAGVRRMAAVFLGSGVAQELEAYPSIVYGGGKGATNESKAAYLHHLAVGFSIIVRHVKGAYLLSEDKDKAAKVFGEILQEMALGVVVQGDDELLRRLATTAKEAGDLLETMIQESSSPLPDHVHQELTLLSTTFTEVEGQCELEYVTEASLVAATGGVKRLAVLFLGSRAAEALKACPTIVYGGGKGATNESKAAYLRHLADAFSTLVHDVKGAYLRRPGGGRD